MRTFCSEVNKIIMSQGKVLKVSGPLVVASGMEDANMFDVVHVGEQGLIGEIIEPQYRYMRKLQESDRECRLSLREHLFR